METVNVQCGHCGKLMAISREHLGGQVSCPHCQGVVQAPPSESEAPPEINVSSQDSVESILGSLENEASDDIFGRPRKPLVELPEPEPSPAGVGVAPEPAGWTDRPRDPAAAQADGAAGTWLESKPDPANEESPPEVSPRKYSAKRSLLVPILLIFLIPYAIFTTAFIAWLLYSRGKAGDPMEFLRDPDPKRDAPERKGKTQVGERVKYDARLPAKLRIPLHKSAPIGDVEITPIKVHYQDGDFALHVKLRNISTDTTFNPLPESFVDPNTFKGNKPYTFLDPGDGKYVFGGFVSYRRHDKGGLFQSSKLHPGEEMVVVLTTAPEAQAQLKGILKTSKDLLWRVQIRRGFVTVDGLSRSATAVVGIEFSTRSVEGKEAAS